MKSTLILSSLASAIVAKPLIAVPELVSSANVVCPNITVVRATVVGDDCPTVNDNSFTYSSRDENTATVTFGRFTVETDNGSSGQRQAKSCTANIELAYPLPLPAGCSNEGSFTVFERGYFQGTGHGDYMTLDTDVTFRDGQSSRFIAGSLPRSFTHHRQTQYTPFSDFYNDRRSGSFVFTVIPPAGSRVPASQGRQTIGTLQFDLNLQLFAKERSQATLDYLDFLVETKGTTRRGSVSQIAIDNDDDEQSSDQQSSYTPQSYTPQSYTPQSYTPQSYATPSYSAPAAQSSAWNPLAFLNPANWGSSSSSASFPSWFH